jgi:NADH-quinone oxidoreductase subunit N
VKDALLVLPELALVGPAVALVLLARRVQRARSAAAGALGGAIAAVYLALVPLANRPATAFDDTIAGDGYAQFFKVLFATTLALAALLSIRHLDAERVRPAEFYALLLLASTGMMLAASALDLLTLYLGLELTSLCSYLLVGITRERPRANEAAIKYFLLGSFASALLLYGIALVYGVTGASHFGSIASALAEGRPNQGPLLLVSIALLAGGLAFKVAAVPFHAWAPDAYQGASAPVAAFLAAGSKAAGLAALGRVALVAFEPEQRSWSLILVGLAAASMAVASLLAVSQSDVKRLLAYSSIAHAGYALLGLIPGTPQGTAATMTYVLVYAFMTLGAFGVVIGLGRRGESLDGYRGLAASSPVTAGLMFLFLLSLTGVPPTAGFAAKFAVILAVVGAGHFALAVLAVACSVVSAFFYLRIAVLMYMTEPEAPAPEPFPATVSAALTLAAAVTVIGGLFPDALAAWTTPP